MSLQEQINNDAVSAFKNGDRFVSETLRGLKSVLINQSIVLKVRDAGLEDAQVEKIVAGEIKKRQESAAIYETANRSELADKERQEIIVLKKYLPTQLSQDQIRQLIEKVADEINFDKNSHSLGQLIGAVKKQTGASADGAIVSKLVQEFIEK